MVRREEQEASDKINDVELVFKEYYGSLCYFASKYLQDEEVIEDIVPVSYTHLDVYKRQPVQIISPRFLAECVDRDYPVCRFIQYI